jgi:hypothetical protein
MDAAWNDLALAESSAASARQTAALAEGQMRAILDQPKRRKSNDLRERVADLVLLVEAVELLERRGEKVPRFLTQAAEKATAELRTTAFRFSTGLFKAAASTQEVA